MVAASSSTPSTTRPVRLRVAMTSVRDEAGSMPVAMLMMDLLEEIGSPR